MGATKYCYGPENYGKISAYSFLIFLAFILPILILLMIFIVLITMSILIKPKSFNYELGIRIFHLKKIYILYFLMGWMILLYAIYNNLVLNVNFPIFRDVKNRDKTLGSYIYEFFSNHAMMFLMVLFCFIVLVVACWKLLNTFNIDDNVDQFLKMLSIVIVIISIIILSTVGIENVKKKLKSKGIIAESIISTFLLFITLFVLYQKEALSGVSSNIKSSSIEMKSMVGGAIKKGFFSQYKKTLLMMLIIIIFEFKTIMFKALLNQEA